MEKKIKSYLNKAKQYQIYPHSFNVYLKYLIVFFFLTLFINSHGQNEIRLIIQGNYIQNFLCDTFYDTPSEVIVNGIEKCSNQKNCDFDKDLNNVTFTFSNKINSCENMFLELGNIIEIDLSNLDTSAVTTMYSMFRGCINLKKINFGNINTTLVNDMKEVFYVCKSLLSIDLSHFDTSSVTTMFRLFSLCESLTSLNVSKFDTSKVVDMYDMFSYCYQLTSIDLSNFNT